MSDCQTKGRHPILHRCHVIAAVQFLKRAARSPAHAKGLVSCDEVRARLVRTGHKNVIGDEVSRLLAQVYGAPAQGRYCTLTKGI